MGSGSSPVGRTETFPEFPERFLLFLSFFLRPFRRKERCVYPDYTGKDRVFVKPSLLVMFHIFSFFLKVILGQEGICVPNHCMAYLNEQGKTCRIHP